MSCLLPERFTLTTSFAAHKRQPLYLRPCSAAYEATIDIRECSLAKNLC